MDLTVTPAGSMSLPIYGAAQLLAASETFQAAVGASNDSAAMGSIFLGEIHGDFETLNDLRPFAVLVHDSHGAVQIGDGAQIHMGSTGGIMLVLTANADPTLTDPSDNYLDFINFIGQVLDEMQELFGSDDGTTQFWPFSTVSIHTYPQRTPPSQRPNEDFWVAAFILNHSVT